MGVYEMRALGILVVAALVGSPVSALADFWQGFYLTQKPAPPAKQEVAQQDAGPSNHSASVCLAEIFRKQEKYAIPDNLLLAIGIQEAGRKDKTGLTVWPWTVNAKGKGMFFQSKSEVVSWVEARRKLGMKSIDVGCMQVNLKWHGKAFDSVQQALEPSANVDYAARFLLGLYHETGDWGKAAGRYHSATEKHQTVYLNALARNHGVARAKASEMSRRVAAAMGLARPTIVAKTEPKTPPPPVFWTSALSNDPNAEQATDTGFSLYSNNPIRPVLPKYRSMF